MKKLYIAATILIFVYRSLYAQAGSLDLPDINVWGYDRSDLPGLYDERIKDRPYLNKNRYLDIPGVKFPQKSYPRKDYIWQNGMDITSGLGEGGEYILALSHDMHWQPGWFMNYKADGIRKNPLEQKDGHSSLFKARLNGGRNKESYGYNGQLDFWQDDIIILKSLYAATADIYMAYDNLKIDIDGGFSALNGDEEDAQKTNLKLNLALPINNYHHINTDVVLDKFKVGQESAFEPEVKLNYLNEVYRETAFSLGAGYDREFIYDIMVSAGINNIGLTGYVKKRRIKKSLYDFITGYTHLQLDRLYKYPVENKVGVKVINHMRDNLEAGIDLSMSRVENHIYFLGSDFLGSDFLGKNSGFFNIRNMPGEVKFTKAHLFVRGDIFKSGFIYRKAGKELPDIYNEFYVDVNVSPFKKLKLDAGIRYAGKHKEWITENDNTVSGTVEPYMDVNTSLTYRVNKDFNICAGVENILGADIIRTAGFRGEESKVFVILNLGIRDN
ncbi:MAG: hypothetical protein PF545_03840 [Elusimicrobia bacterium]|jgi:hypothetical protein|nr:hypothetical protein [Elusimicrobiota bacterium]